MASEGPPRKEAPPTPEFVGDASASASALPSIAEMQEIAKTQYRALSVKLPLGQGEFKRILPFAPGIALAVTKESGPKQQEMLNKECEYLRFLLANDLPALRVHGDIFDIDGKGKYAVLVDAIPKHTFVDGKDPGTLKTILPSILLDVEIPKGEAWFFHKRRIEAEIQKKLLDPEVLTAAQEKAARLLTQLQGILDTINRKGITIVDLQLLVDKSGRITIIDPLDILRPTATKGVYTTLDGSPAETGIGFDRKIMDTYRMLTETIQFCREVATAKDPNILKALVTPLLGDASAMPYDDMSALGSPKPSVMMERAKPFAMGYESRRMPSFDAPPSPPMPHRALSSGLSSSGYRPSVFSPMPPPALLPTASNVPKDPPAAAAPPPTKGVVEEPKDKPPTPPAHRGSRPGSPTTS